MSFKDYPHLSSGPAAFTATSQTWHYARATPPLLQLYQSCSTLWLLYKANNLGTNIVNLVGQVIILICNHSTNLTPSSLAR